MKGTIVQCSRNQVKAAVKQQQVQNPYLIPFDVNIYHAVHL